MLLLLVLFWAGMLVLRFVMPMLGGGSSRRGPGPKVLIPTAVLTLAGLLFDQAIHGRFL
ncbi:MAG TPA: hypothetical protein VHL54_10400 [Actinomycetota bacterium]|nr:hypothetical protein [Actinomycetota bacterium]